MAIELITGKDDEGRRLDRILRKALPDHSLSLIHRLLRQGKIKVNGKSASNPAERIVEGAVIQIQSKRDVNLSPAQVNPFPSPAPLPEIIWQGAGVIFFNKPAGLASHGPGSLDTLVKTALEGKLPHSLSFKPGPLHRLDKPSSGIIAFSQTLDGARQFSRLMREQKITKTYLAIVEGRVDRETVWQDTLIRDTSIEKTFVNSETKQTREKPKNAVTSVKPLACNGFYTLIEVQIKTGRTHQIRAQAAAHGNPLAGDKKYGGKSIAGKRGGGFSLHAWKIKVCAIKTAQTTAIDDIKTSSISSKTQCGFPAEITAPLPEAFQSQIAALFGLRNFTTEDTEER